MGLQMRNNSLCSAHTPLSVLCMYTWYGCICAVYGESFLGQTSCPLGLLSARCIVETP